MSGTGLGRVAYGMPGTDTSFATSPDTKPSTPRSQCPGPDTPSGCDDTGTAAQTGANRYQFDAVVSTAGTAIPRLVRRYAKPSTNPPLDGVRDAMSSPEVCCCAGRCPAEYSAGKQQWQHRNILLDNGAEKQAVLRPGLLLLQVFVAEPGKVAPDLAPTPCAILA
eukprot:1742616-Rhodomonas_salina.2